MKFRVYKLFGKPIVAMPDISCRLRILAWQRYQPFTLRRLLFQRFIQILVFIHCDGIFSHLSNNPFEDNDNFAFQYWVSELQNAMRMQSVLPIIVWPPQKDRGRVYVHLLDQFGRPVGFVKLSFDPANDRCLKSEVSTLKYLNTQQLKTFIVPNLLCSGTLGGYTYLVMEPLPNSAKPVKVFKNSYPKKLIEEFKKTTRMVRKNELESFMWWKSFCDAAIQSFPHYLEFLVKLIEEYKLPVCRVHGDLSPANLVLENSQIWVFDWEESTENGPILLDTIGYDLAIHQNSIKKCPKRELTRFFNHNIRSAGLEKRRDILAALAFRYTFAPSVTQLYIDELNSRIEAGSDII